MEEADTTGLLEPMIVRAHTTPWGFAVALPLALAFTYLAARGLDADLAPPHLGALDEPPTWLFSALLLAFALMLFSVGIGELARWLKPTVLVVIDRRGVSSFSHRGEHRLAWPDVIAARIEPDRLRLEGRDRRRGTSRALVLRFDRLAIAPASILARVYAHRPDLDATGGP